MWNSGPEFTNTLEWSVSVTLPVSIAIVVKLRWESIDPAGRSMMAAV